MTYDKSAPDNSLIHLRHVKVTNGQSERKTRPETGAAAFSPNTQSEDFENDKLLPIVTTMTYGKFHVWAEYFNNLKKCWEPLLERLIATGLYEISPIRAMGITIRTESAIHINISGAFFRTLNDCIRMMQSASHVNTKKSEVSLLKKMFINQSCSFIFYYFIYRAKKPKQEAKRFCWIFVIKMHNRPAARSTAARLMTLLAHASRLWISEIDYAI